MQGILRYIHDNPAQGDALMRQNRSYVFFRENPQPSAVGAMGVPVMAQTSVAADPLVRAAGRAGLAPTDRANVGGLWVAQDTGGAIKGPNRSTASGARRRCTPHRGRDERPRPGAGVLPKGTLARLGR
jgi:membrane-bound lytic murein transglycosylase A